MAQEDDVLKVDLALLSRLMNQGGHLFDPPGIGESFDTHREFEYWVRDVSTAFNDEPAFKAEWLSLPVSPLVTADGYDADGSSWPVFVKVVRIRMAWLSKTIRESTAAAAKDKASEPLPPLVFDKIVDDEQAVAELGRRWDEAGKCMVAGAYLAAVIMYGSILEGVLSTVLENDPAMASRSRSAPKKDGKTKSFREWGLADWINVAHENAFISDDAKHFNIALRDYRNMIHPREALARTSRAIDEHTCRICLEIVHKSVREVERKLSLEVAST